MAARRERTAAVLAGAVNGLFGGGGGMVLLPLLQRQKGLEGRRLFATSLAVIFPMCLISGAVYLLRGGVSLAEAAPYLLGGLAGGVLGGATFQKVPVRWLKAAFAGFLLYGGVRYLL